MKLAEGERDKHAGENVPRQIESLLRKGRSVGSKSWESVGDSQSFVR